MAEKLKLLVVTPEKKVVDAEADDVTLPGELGYLGILPGHAPLITLLKTGVLSYSNAGKAGEALAIAGGFAEVASDGVTVLAGLAEGRQDIDVALAERERAEAEAGMKTASLETLDALRAQEELASARLFVARRTEA